MTDRKSAETTPSPIWEAVLREAGLTPASGEPVSVADCTLALLHLVRSLDRVARDWGAKAQDDPTYAECAFEVRAMTRAVLGGRAPYTGQLTDDRILEISRDYVVGGLEFDSEERLVAFVRYLLAGGR